MGEGDGDVLMHAGGHAVSALHALSMGEHSNTPENRPPAGWLVPENRGVLQVTTSSRWQRGGPMGHGDKDRRRREVGELRRSQLGQKKFGPGAAKRMGTSSESCKLQDEQYQYYKNLDDEKNQFLDGQTIQLVYKKFNMVFFGQLQIIPEEVVRRFKSEIPGEIKLETRNGYSHTIVVAKNQENLVLTVGWRQFVENYDLQMDDSLIFRYKGNSQFSVMIFDKLGREKALSVVPAPFLPQVQDRRNEAHEIG
ncbi:B3 domain-containing protein Os08g0324300-like [Aegilops tauschii subsp. strangulata]|uniref:B3 domain-containing protein Os08g0324300-like n=1 Tax=Aegilops tauschii subsp. strangulata TaxID=200361 RepID=UPI003CC85801